MALKHAVLLDLAEDGMLVGIELPAVSKYGDHVGEIAKRYGVEELSAADRAG